MSASEPAAHYDRVTPAWSIVLGDDLHHGLFRTPGTGLRAATTALTDELADLAGVSAGQAVLDVGCGIGGSARRLAVERDAQVLGITTSEVQVAAARERSAADGLEDRARFELRDGADTGLPDASFDVVWSVESSQYITPREVMIDECARLLAPGGRLALCDVVLHHELTLRDLRRWHHEFDVLRATFGDGQLAPRDDYPRLAGRAGLEVTHCVDESTAIRPTFAAWRASAESQRARASELFGAPAFAAFIEGCSVLERFFDAEIMGYLVLVARR